MFRILETKGGVSRSNLLKRSGSPSLKKPMVDEFRTQAVTLAMSGIYQSYVQIGVALEAEGFKGAIRRLGADQELKYTLNRFCTETRTPAGLSLPI